MRACTERGFSLIEAAVALAVVAILAGLMAPLGARALNQQREYRTREGLKAAFEGLFGARDRRVANCRADFGFDPAASLSDLRVMVNTSGTSWAGTLGYGNTLGWLCGWNGPYWAGPTDAVNRPLDGWGRPLQLVVNGPAWQVLSAGPDGVAGTADDLVFPAVAPPYLAYNSTVILVVTRASANITGTATLNWVYGTSPASVSRAIPNLVAAPTIGNTAALSQALANTGTQTLTWNAPAGVQRFYLAPSGSGSFTPITLVLDLLPGETRQLSLTL